MVGKWPDIVQVYLDNNRPKAVKLLRQDQAIASSHVAQTTPTTTTTTTTRTTVATTRTTVATTILATRQQLPAVEKIAQENSAAVARHDANPPHIPVATFQKPTPTQGRPIVHVWPLIVLPFDVSFPLRVSAARRFRCL